MRFARRTGSALIALLAMLPSLSSAATGATGAAPAHPATAAPPRAEIATFAGGCFWSMESQFEGAPGVLSVVSGYTGGHTANPTYEEVGTGTTGHYESIEIRFDPAKTSYDKLVDVYWHSIDPTQGDGQFCDIGTEYRTVIFYHGDGQRRVAEESKKKIDASHVLKKPIATRIVAAGPFFPAEDYHQDFRQKNPEHYMAYRMGCGKDRRLAEIWGKKAAKLPHS